MSSLQKPIDAAEYLFRRLSECGVQSVHGVPGDYNLVALDYLPECGLKWVGSVNELNAGQSPSIDKSHLIMTSFGRVVCIHIHAHRTPTFTHHERAWISPGK